MNLISVHVHDKENVKDTFEKVLDKFREKLNFFFHFYCFARLWTFQGCSFSKMIATAHENVYWKTVSVVKRANTPSIIYDLYLIINQDIYYKHYSKK